MELISYMVNMFAIMFWLFRVYRNGNSSYIYNSNINIYDF